MWGIILWILQSFLNATWMILTKKVVENKKVWNNWQTLISRWNHAIFLAVLFILSYFFFQNKSLELNIPQSFWNFKNIALFLIATFWLYVTYPLRRIAYANEKVSTLQPFAMLFQVFPVILGFIFIASERANLITFLTAILASVVVIIPNIDFKNFKMNKYSLMVLTSSIIKSAQVFAVLYFLTILSPSNFYFIESLLIIMISSFLIFVKGEFNEVKLISKKYAKLLFWANFVAIISILLSLTMYHSLWVVLTSLLSLLYLVFIYILGYFILKEKPTKKDVIITILVSILIIIWVIFKN